MEDNYEPSKKALTIKSVIDDPEVEEVEIKVILKEGIKVAGLSSFLVERAVLKWSVTHIPIWVEYISTHGMSKIE
jgi:hypothetical protein